MLKLKLITLLSQGALASPFSLTPLPPQKKIEHVRQRIFFRFSSNITYMKSTLVHEIIPQRVNDNLFENS